MMITTDKIPKKLGTIAKDQNDNLVLCNSDGKAFSTNDSIIVIWQLCDGTKSIDQIYKDIKNSSEVKTEVISLIEKFLINKLVTIE